MTEYAIIFARSARKELGSMDEKIVNRIFDKILDLSLQPRPAGCRKLTGNKNLWRIRIGDYRVLYSIDDKEFIVDVVAVRDRKDVYR